MYHYKMTKLVNRKKKPMTGVLKTSIVVFTIIFILMGIVFSRSFLFSAFLLAGLYFLYDLYSDKSYEYTLDDNAFFVDLILGKRKRKRVQELDLAYLEVLAPHWHKAVEKYRKDKGGVVLSKYDYTSYEEEIEYYTMIIADRQKKIKLLLDLDEEMLFFLKRKYPQKVFLDTFASEK